MFSGIIEELGKIDGFDRKADGGARMAVLAPALGPQCGTGDSVAVSGVCLTVTEHDDERLVFDLSQETLDVTGLGDLSMGGAVNLELSLKVGDRIGGHFVSGHVDQVGRIIDRREEGDCFIFRIWCGLELTDLMVGRGSVTVDGISLTVTKILKDAFEVVIIPHTAEVTTLGFKKAGDSVNLEADMIGKYVAKLVRS